MATPNISSNPFSSFLPPDFWKDGILWRWNPTTKSYKEAGTSFDPNTGIVGGSPPTTGERLEPWNNPPPTTPTPKVDDIMALLTGGGTGTKGGANEPTVTDPYTGEIRSTIDGRIVGYDQNIVSKIQSQQNAQANQPKTGTVEHDGFLWGYTLDPNTGARTETKLGASSAPKVSTSRPLPPGQSSSFTDGQGNVWTWDEVEGRYNISGYTQPPSTTRKPYGKNPYDDPNTPQEEGQFNPYTGQYEPPPGYESPQAQAKKTWDEQQAAIGQQRWQDEFAYNKLQNQQSLDWSRQQFGMQQEAQKAQQLANLRANPASWLEAASMAGQTPVVQPWMVPLGQAGQGLRVGEPIPGYNPQGASMNLPQLMSPSAQYMSRIAPSAQAQYAGYQQAATGATPQDTNWQLWNRSAPSGQYGGLSYGR